MKKVFDGKLTIIEAYYSLDTGEVTKLRLKRGADR